MSPELVVELIRESMVTCFLVAAPPMGLALAVGLTISIFQSVTQINEITMTFIPKIVAVFASFLLFGPFMLDTLMKFSINIFTSIPDMVK